MSIFKSIGETVSSVAHNFIIGCKQHSPEILLGTSIVLAAGAVVTACIQTTKLDKIVDEHNETLDKIDGLVESGTAQWEDKKGERHPYDAEQGKKDKFCAHRSYVLKLVGNYWLPVTLFGLSMAAGIGSLVIMKNRLAASVTFANGLLASMSAYRARVAEKIGEEAERDLYFDRGKVTVVEDDGKELRSRTVNVDRAMDQPFVIKFNQSTAPEMWDKDPEITLATLRSVEEWVEEKCFGRLHGCVITYPQALSKLKYKLSDDKAKLFKQLTAGWTPEMADMLEYEGLNGIKHVDFGLGKYEDRRNWPVDGDWILEINCQCLSPSGYRL